MSRQGSLLRRHAYRIAAPPSGNGIGRKSTITDMTFGANELWARKRNRIGVRRAHSAVRAAERYWN